MIFLLAALLGCLPARAGDWNPQPGTMLEARLEYDGRPLGEVTSAKPRLWFRNEASGQAQDVRGQPGSNDRFAIADLHPGRYGVSVHVDADTSNPAGFPGDFYGWETFQVSYSTQIVIPLRRIMRLRSPTDNASKTAVGCSCDDYPVLPRPARGPLRFEWDGVDPLAEYRYAIYRYRCPYERINVSFQDRTDKTEMGVWLSGLRDDEFYLFELSAWKDGRQIGVLMTNGSRCESWDYRFRTR